MNRLLYSLLLTVSLYGVTPNESCPNNNPPYVSSVFGLDINVGCLNPNYYRQETTYTCNSNNISKKVQYYDNSQYCSSGRKYVKHDIYTYNSVASCPLGEFPNIDGVCEPFLDTNNNGVPDTCDPDHVDYLTSDCNGDGIPNATDPEEDPDGDGYKNKCDPSWENFKGADCDGDGQSNWSDPDVDDDTIPNALDDDPLKPLTGEQLEGSPSCAEMKAIAEQKCPIGRHSWACTEKYNIDVVTKNHCFIDKSPCDEQEEKMKGTCSDGFILLGSCADNGVTITRNTLKCEPIEEKSPICRGTIFEILNATEDACICKDGYTRNSYGRCWKSPIDANSTSEEIENDAQAQEKQNEEIKDREEKEEQQKADNNATAQTSLDLETQNETLKGIRDDLNSSNSYSKSLEDKLNENIEVVEDAEILDLLEQKQGIIEDMLGQYETFGTNVETHFSDIQSKFSETQSLFSSSQSFQVQSGNTANCLSFVLNGKTISFDLCTSFALFAPIVYFVLTIIFMVSTFRFMVNHLLKGLE